MSRIVLAIVIGLFGGFAQKVVGSTVAALPPDVRRGLCPAVRTHLRNGAVPSVRAMPEDFWAKGRTSGTAVKTIKTSRRGLAFAAHQAAKPLKTDFLCKALIEIGTMKPIRS